METDVHVFFTVWIKSRCWYRSLLLIDSGRSRNPKGKNLFVSQATACWFGFHKAAAALLDLEVILVEG